MRKLRKHISYHTIILSVIASIALLSSCEDFLDPEQELSITEDKLYSDWYEYRAIEMGLYGLQQQLVEQIVILGELRGDLLTITPNADADMVEIYNFNVSKDNKYASPTNFFKLISATNNFIRILKKEHPEVLDATSPVTNYDRLYGEALCMRAWAYFNAVRIYGKVPFIHESLVTMEEIQDYVNSSSTYIDSVYIEFSIDGYYNDTIYNKPIELEKNLYDTEMIIDYFTNQLEREVKAVGVNHYIDNNDETWEITIWNPYAMHTLLGHMYLTNGNYAKASEHFEFVYDNPLLGTRYQLDDTYREGNWPNIFSNVENNEQIFTLWFSKTYFQQNDFQSIFSAWGPHDYMLKPTKIAIDHWETVWRGQSINRNANPAQSEMINPGFPSDYFRGIAGSYMYFNNGVPITGPEYISMITLRAAGDNRNSRSIMENYDTVVYKYSLFKETYDQDINFIVYRAASVHLYMAEIYTYWKFVEDDVVVTRVPRAVGFLNDGSNYTPSLGRAQLGVRGRVGLGLFFNYLGNIAAKNEDDQILIQNIIYEHDPYTNEIIGYRDLSGNLAAKQRYLEEQIMNERARELAFEGERFYDLMRVAKRRNDPSYLASLVSAKYPAGEREIIYNRLLDENNWYINYFE
jgi:hypothetical protein